MRIVYVYPQLAMQGGVERILIDKMNLLSAVEGYEVHVVTYDQGAHPLAFPLDERVLYTDLEVRTHAQYQYGGFRRLWEGMKRSRWLRCRMKKVLRQLSPDIIVATTNGPLSLLTALKGKTPLVVESHGGYHHLIDYAIPSLAHRMDIRSRYRLLHKAAAVVTLTETDAQRWRKEYENVRVFRSVKNNVNRQPTADLRGALCTAEGHPQSAGRLAAGERAASRLAAAPLRLR